jgi:ABC-type transport system substrate-binding protein
MRGSGVLPAAIFVASALLSASCAPAAPAPGPTSASAPAAPAQATAAPAAGTPQRGGTLVVAFNADPETLDPHITTALLASRVIALIHDNLINRDYDGSFKPALAEKWDISPDGKVYTFTLKKGVKFHSGKDFTSADVKYTFERWLSTEKSPTSFAIKPIDKIDTPDPQTVVFMLKEPYNIFLDQVAGSFAVILNQAAVEKAGSDYGVTAADGTGPFKFVSWTRNQKILLARNDAYSVASPMFQNSGPAYVDGVEIRIIPEDNTRLAEFQAGNVQLVQDVPQGDVDRLTRTPGVSIVKYDQLQTSYLGFNTAKPPFDDARVRQAVSLAINRDEIVTGANFGLGTPARTMLTPNTPFYWTGSEQAAPTFDLAKAGSLLDQAGWTPGAGGIREKGGQQLVLPLWIINPGTSVLQAQILEQQLAKVGIKVDTKQYEQTAWFAAARSGEQVGFIIGIFFENPDGILYFYFYSKQQPAPNRFSYSVPEVDKWLEDSRVNPDKNAVTMDYENVQKKIIEDAVTAPLVHELGTLGKADAAMGVKVHPSRWLYRMLDIWLKK